MLEGRQKKNMTQFIYLMFEHIKKKNENIFLKNLSKSLNSSGVLITGTPSLEFQKYVKNPDPTHYNCKTKAQLEKALLKYFDNVLYFQ